MAFASAVALAVIKASPTNETVEMLRRVMGS
jgi:hypothetical protein